MKPGRIIGLIFGIIIALLAFALIVGGGALAWAYGTQRDADGYMSSPDYRLDTTRYALASGDIDLASGTSEWWPENLLDVRITASRADSEGVFVGIGPTSEVAAYLDGVAYDEVTHLGRRTDISYRPHEGSAVPAAPADQDFWVVSASGPGTQTVTWDAAQGAWTIVVMNATATPGVTVDFTAAARVGLLLPIGVGLLVGGLVIGALATLLIIWSLKGRREPAAAAEAEASAGTAAPLPLAAPAAVAREGAYPAALAGALDADLSRGMWLIKWLLAVPHYFCLAFLWAAFALLTVIAFFAILFTGRYPKGLFEFNVGVLRWNWRVAFYAFNPAGTDRYPPFSLEDDPTYPARLEIPYPERLSRGLVLVKWWLLAIPHYIIVGILTSGVIWWGSDWAGKDTLRATGGVMGILTFIALVVLLFSGRYPKGLFDLVMGFNRWVIRVAAYAGLMRDEYPPFRLDMGPDDPSGLAAGGRVPPSPAG